MSPSLLIPLVYAATVLETWLSFHWQSGVASVNLLLLIAFTWLIPCGGPYAFVTAGLVGLISDLNHSAPLGIEMAIYAAIAYTVLWLRSQFNAERLPAQLALFFSATIVITTAEAITAICLRECKISLSAMLQRIALVSLCTTIAALPILFSIHWRRSKHHPLRLASPSKAL
jgi:rod shape-determining protein MreD